ncbi:Dihydropteroate synthase-like protein [Crassisporium funariophilum]|nr:Dihydropteroate synthase-like protein [Crassisporium funariophilum]
MTSTISSQAVATPDCIRINDFVFPVSLRTGAHWPQKINDEAVLQPISISLTIHYDVRNTASTDDINFSINYAEIADSLRTVVSSRTFSSLQDLARYVATSLENKVADIIDNSKSQLDDGFKIHFEVKQLKPPLHCRLVGLEFTAKYHGNEEHVNKWKTSKIRFSVADLVCPVIIGVNAAERLERQNVTINLEIDALAPVEWGVLDDIALDFRTLSRVLCEEVSKSEFKTLEALTSCVAFNTLAIIRDQCYTPIVHVRVAKPSALIFASSSEVQISRTFTDYPTHSFDKVTLLISSSSVASPSSMATGGSPHVVAIALGSNLGDSFNNIESALRLLEYFPREGLAEDGFPLNPFINIIDTSFMYETAPMYVEDQPSFKNCACLVETNLPALLLLRLLKKIESVVGRVPSIRNGPRAVDLDIIFYDDEVIDTRINRENLDNLEGQLVVPHPLVQEREFVLRPLSDMIPDFVHPIIKRSIHTLLIEVCDPAAPPMNKVVPFPRFPLPPATTDPYPLMLTVPATLTHWTYPSRTARFPRARREKKTHVMATLNVTPDSFSDGAIHDEISAALNYVRDAVSTGATIIDVGGYSTRPGASFVSVEDECARVVPVIESIRDRIALPTVEQPGSYIPDIVERILNTPISVDTFRWEVAEAAIVAGANCINDVYSFTGPDSYSDDEGKRASEYMTEMKAVARKYAVPVILMHSRGDAGQNKDYSAYSYADTSPGSTLEGVRVELGGKVDRIVRGKGGVRRWLVIADPGIGFSKTLEANLEVLRDAARVVEDVRIGAVMKYRNPLAGLPLLIGASRKSFLGAILALEPDGKKTQPQDRLWATAAAVSGAVQQGALIVRVHDVKEMVDVVRVAEALWP